MVGGIERKEVEVCQKKTKKKQKTSEATGFSR